MKRFSVVLKDVLTETTCNLGTIRAVSKEEVVLRWSLNKGRGIPCLEYYWHPNMREVLVFIHEISETDLNSLDAEAFGREVMQFNHACYE